MSDRLRIGFIGCGGISLGHAQRLQAVPEAEIVALCDTSDASIQRLVKHVPALEGLPVYQDYRELLEKERLDAVEIASPHTSHFQQIMDSLDLGLHVLTEKPMVCSVAHAREMVAKAEKSGKVLGISYQLHFMGAFRHMRDRFAKGDMGALTFMSALQGQRWLHGTRGSWRQDPALSGGGQLNDSGSHLLDIILWVSGMGVSEVFAFIDNRGAAVDINSALSVRFANGAQGTFSVVGDSRCGWWEDITFWGEDGTFFYRNGKLFEQLGDKAPEEVTDLPAFSNPDQNFVYSILGREEPQVPPLCGLRVIELTEAAWLSAERGLPVKVERTA